MLITVVSILTGTVFSCLALAASDCFSAASVSCCRATMPCGKTSATSSANTVRRRPIGLHVIRKPASVLRSAESDRPLAGPVFSPRICPPRSFDDFHPLACRRALEADLPPIPRKFDGAEDASIQVGSSGALVACRPTPTARSTPPPPPRPAPRRCRRPRTPAARAPAPEWTAGFPSTAERRPGGGKDPDRPDNHLTQPVPRSASGETRAAAELLQEKERRRRKGGYGHFFGGPRLRRG